MRRGDAGFARNRCLPHHVTWLGVVTHRRDIEIETEPRQSLDNWIGTGLPVPRIVGRTRASDSRVLQQHPWGTDIINVRQLSIVSQEEIDQIARDMGLAHFNPQWLGATMVLSGCPDFSHLPPSSRLQAPQGTTLVVDMQNYPCHQVGMTIERDLPGQGKSFQSPCKGQARRDRMGRAPRRPGLGRCAAPALPRATGLAGGRTNALFIGLHSWFGLGDPKNKVCGTNQHGDMQNENVIVSKTCPTNVP